MNKKKKDEQFAAHLPGVLRYHQLMLTDRVRNRLLYKSIRQCVTRGTNFLDVGAGTGVWAILAAKLGAKRVVAVEMEECLIPIIYRHAKENGVEDRIEIIHGNSNDLKVRGKFDVIVCEIFGQDAIGKATIDSIIDLRNRFLSSDGILIPQGLMSYAVPVHSQRSITDVPADLPIQCEFLKSLQLNYAENLGLADRKPLDFLAEPKPLLELDLASIETAPTLDLTASWKLRNISRANGFAMFTRSVFTDGVRMDGFASQSWGTLLYEFEPFAEKAGTIEFRLQLDQNRSIWTVSTPSNPTLDPRVQSPAFAAARLRMAQQTTPHRKLRMSRGNSGLP